MNMAERSGDARMMTVQQASAYCGMGKNTFRKWADQIGATRKFGTKMLRYDRAVIDRVLDEMSSENPVTR